MPDYDRLSREIAECLRFAGLHEHSFDAPDDGGFSLHATDKFVSVGWYPTSALASPAHERLRAGDTSHPDVALYGEILGIMTDAIADILRATGFDARRSADPFTSERIEVTASNQPRGSSRPQQR